MPQQEVTLDDGTGHKTAAVICTIGTRPDRPIQTLGFATDRGRLVTPMSMSIPAHPGKDAAMS